MKTKFLFLAFLLFPLLAFAADADPVVTPPAAAGQLSSLLLLLIPVLVPLVVAIGKFIVPKVPLWALPILAPALGALLDYLGSFATGGTANPLIGALLGSAGVGVRELVDQVRGRIGEVAKTAPLILLCAALPIATLTPGCALFQSKPTVEAVVFHSFRDSWTLTKAAYDSFSERVVLGKITQENSDKVDVVWNKYRISFKAALSFARQDWSATTPESLLVLQKELLTLIAQLSSQ